MSDAACVLVFYLDGQLLTSVYFHATSWKIFSEFQGVDGSTFAALEKFSFNLFKLVHTHEGKMPVLTHFYPSKVPLELLPVL